MAKFLELETFFHLGEKYGKNNITAGISELEMHEESGFEMNVGTLLYFYVCGYDVNNVKYFSLQCNHTIYQAWNQINHCYLSCSLFMNEFSVLLNIYTFTVSKDFYLENIMKL